jgi:hypothetical protein
MFSRVTGCWCQCGGGGILIAWKQSMGVTGERRIDVHSTSVQFCPAEGQTLWLTYVYGPQGNEEKIQFMQELCGVREVCHGPWVIVGDFNLIYRAEDKNKDTYNRAMMGQF